MSGRPLRLMKERCELQALQCGPGPAWLGPTVTMSDFFKVVVPQAGLRKTAKPLCAAGSEPSTTWLLTPLP